MCKKYFKVFSVILGIVVLTACTTQGLENTIPDANQSSLNILPYSSSSTLWTDMSRHYDMVKTPYPLVLQNQIDWYLNHPKILQRLTNNASPYLYYVYQEIHNRNLPAELALLPMVESAYNPFVYSRVGAIGLWQMMPGTGSGFGLNINWWYDGRRDIVASTEAALHYLTYLHNYFDDWLLAIAAYNSGEGTVQAAIDRNKSLGKPTDFWSLPLPPETKLYVPKLLALSIIVKKHENFSVSLPNIPNAPYFSVIPMTEQMDLQQVAQLADTNDVVVRTLNPGFRRWATPPKTNYHLLLPNELVEKFKIALANLPEGQRVNWYHHPVKKRETLNMIAIQYHTDARVLMQANRLTSPIIRVNQDLIIPQSFHGNLEQPTMTASISRAAIAEEKLPGPQQELHIVQKNDSLFTIAHHYGVSPRQIQFWNKMNKDEEVKPLQELVLWLPHHSRPSLPTGSYYTVKSGDNLTKIARQYHTSSQVLQNINHLQTISLHAGQKLSLPSSVHTGNASAHAVTASVSSQHIPSTLTKIAKNSADLHTVKTGETLYSIATYYHMNATQLTKLNHLSTGTYIKPGQQLIVH